MPRSWDDLSDFLARGRKKYERPAYDRNLRVWKENKWHYETNIHIGWSYQGSYQPFVTWHYDGTMSINGALQPSAWGGTWSPLRSQSVRLTIRRYADIDVVQRNWKYYIVDYDAPRTPVKIQGCRNCKQSGFINSWCSYSTCWDVEMNDNVFSCPTHPHMDLSNHQSSTYGLKRHIIPCEHGEESGHTVPKGQQCYSCGGSGKRNYGGKLALIQWDGTPLRVRDGKVIHTTATESLLERMMADVVETVS